MRIGIIPHLNYPIKPPFKGGLERFTHLFTEGLTKAGHEPVLFSPFDADEQFDTVSFLRCSLGDYHYDLKDKAYSKMFDYIKDNIEDFDVIHNHSLSSLVVELGGQLDIPFISTIHTPPFKELREVYLSDKANPSCYHTIVSQSCYKEWKDILQGNKHRVIHNGVDLSQWNYQHTGQPETAVYFGRMHRDKAPHLAIQAAVQAGFRIRLAGPISDKDYYIECVEPLLHPDKAVYLGLLSGVQLAELVGSSSVMVNSPKWPEPFGLVLVEALACGTPIASFNKGAIREIVTDTIGVVTEEDTVEDLACAIKDAAKLNRAWCRRHVEANFSLNGMIEEYIKLYKQVCLPSSTTLCSSM